MARIGISSIKLAIISPPIRFDAAFETRIFDRESARRRRFHYKFRLKPDARAERLRRESPSASAQADVFQKTILPEFSRQLAATMKKRRR